VGSLPYDEIDAIRDDQYPVRVQFKAQGKVDRAVGIFSISHAHGSDFFCVLSGRNHDNPSLAHGFRQYLDLPLILQRLRWLDLCHLC